MAERYHSRHALNCPSHITVFPPFRWPISRINDFKLLTNFCQDIPSVPITLDGFGVFAPRVIFVRPNPTPRLLDLHRQLHVFLQKQFELTDPMASRRAFTPHITIAHRDLSPRSYDLAWQEYQKRSLQASFVVTHLTLLQHAGERWRVIKDWPFKARSLSN